MHKRIVLLVILIPFAISLKADSLQRLSAIAAGTPRDNQAIDIYDYLANGEATVVIDISDSTLPIVTYSTTGTLCWSKGLFIQDSLIYVNRVPDFWIGRLFPPDSIVQIAYYDLVNPNLVTPPWGIEAKDTILYIADGTEGLFIFDVSDPTNPTQITYYDTPDNLTEFFIADSLIYLADCDSLIILNIANPALPQYVGAVDIPTTCTDVHVVYPYAYATAYSSFGTDGSVKIIDVSDPTNPIIVGSINNIRGDPRAVFVNDNYIYCAAKDWWDVPERKGKTRADVEGGIRVAYGVTPESLIISYDTPGDPREIFVRENLLLIPDYDSLQILLHNKTGIEEYNTRAISLISKFVISPNPTKGKLTCAFQFNKPSRITVSIYDELGRKIREIYHGPMIDGNVHFYWDGRDNNRNIVSAGEYFVRIATQDGSFSESRKVIFIGDK